MTTESTSMSVCQESVSMNDLFHMLYIIRGESTGEAWDLSGGDDVGVTSCRHQAHATIRLMLA